ncbi:Cytosolic seryl-tRNA synthetase [Phytophthora pseudosyringae]|uniref:serine--tRNA ligase n=1 Tax=Phytophthora pseudosyringae TaxID=221518 RepID=A0A8T1W8W0_9STRA|nr:Cytosolic seryl-tRNA synthetase [Phytophthora pseudosyringae]
MPIDINRLRPERGGDPDSVRADQQKRFLDVDIVNKVIELDEQWRKKQGEVETISMKMNALQQEIKKLSKAKEDFKAISDERKELAASLPEKKKEADALKELVDRELPKIGNVVDPTVPVSSNEDENVVVKKWGTPIQKDGLHFHHEVLHRIDGYEPERGVQVAGHRAYFLTGYGFLLEQALMAYATAFLMKAQYKMLKPPFFMNKECMASVAQLDDFDEQLYKVVGEDEKYLIATSEQPICGYHKGEWITESSLPLRYGGFSTCFRKEAGSHGKDTWGIFRVHQFDKMEQFCITDPESSSAMHEEMLRHAEEFYQSLNLPYRVVNIVSGELNNAAVKKFDLEAWFPAYKEYRELVSASNCTDFQSRAMEIRCGVKKENQREKKYVHMLNSTLCASTRTVCCILENCQDENGVKVPEVLVPFMGGVTYLPFTRDVKVNVQAAKMQKAAKKKGGKQ